MNRSPFPSTPPPSQPSPYRYLGRGGGERPIRVQIIIALVAGLILVAVPLYLWRRPQPESIKNADAAVVDAGFVSLDASIADAAPPEPEDGLKLSEFNTLRCQDPGPGKTPPEKCDHVSFFEDGLARAIRESKACAPSSSSSYRVSFVLEMHFRKKQWKVYLGKSTTLKRGQAKELLKCVQRAMKPPEWDSIRHEHAKYVVNLMVDYPPEGSL